MTSTKLVEPSATRSTRLARVAPIATFIGVLLVVFWRSPPAKVPGIDTFEAIASGWPRISLDSAQVYILHAPLGQIVYHAFDSPRSVTTFLMLHIYTLAVAYVLLCGYIWSKVRGQQALIAICVFSLLPLWAVELGWLGLYDAFTLIAWAAVIWSLDRRREVQYLAAVLAGVQAFEQISIGIVLLWLVAPFFRTARPKFSALTMLAGTVSGTVLLSLYLSHEHASSGSKLAFLGQPGELNHVVAVSFFKFSPILYSTLGGLWGFAIVYFQRYYRSWTRALWLRGAAALALWFAADLIVTDKTRVLQLTAVPVFVLIAIEIGRSIPDLRQLWRTAQWYVLLVSPALVVFDYLDLQTGVRPHQFNWWFL